MVPPLSLHERLWLTKLLSANQRICASQIVGIDASHFYPYSMCQPTLTGLYTRWNYDSESQKFMHRQNETGSFENMVLSYFQQTRPEYQIESNVTTGRQKKIDCFSVDGICNHFNIVFETMGCYCHYCPYQEARPSLTGNEIMRGIKKREQDQMRKECIQQKGYKIIEMWECNWWELYRTDATGKIFIFEQISPISDLSAKNGSCKRLGVEICLVMFNATAKFLNI